MMSSGIAVCPHHAMPLVVNQAMGYMACVNRYWQGQFKKPSLADGIGTLSL